MPTVRNTIMLFPRILVLALTVACGLSSCTSTEIVNQWGNPEYGSPHFRKILVIGVSRQPSIRRAFEDEFVSKLKAVGVDAEPSYRYIPEDGKVDGARTQQPVRQASADAAIITRLVRVEKKTEVSPGFINRLPPLPLVSILAIRPPGSVITNPPVYQYDVYISETSLYDTAKNQLVWNGTVQTTDPRDLNKELKRYVDTVIDALKKKNLLALENPDPSC